MRAAFTLLILAIATLTLGPLVLLCQLLGRPRGPGSIIHKAPIWWGRALVWAGGVRITAHHHGTLPDGQPCVYVANHVSWFDIPVLISVLPDHGFVAKRELSEIFVFGKAARAVGVIYIDRENTKSAFAAYEEAAETIRHGRSVIVYPEGTRGDTYELRPFKKGPFVLAIRAGVPIVPVLIHGTIAVSPRTSWHVRAGAVDVHLLEPIPTAGLTYQDRVVLADTVRARLSDALRQYHPDEPVSPDAPRVRAKAPATSLPLNSRPHGSH